MKKRVCVVRVIQRTHKYNFIYTFYLLSEDENSGNHGRTCTIKHILQMRTFSIYRTRPCSCNDHLCPLGISTARSKIENHSPLQVQLQLYGYIDKKCPQSNICMHTHKHTQATVNDSSHSFKLKGKKKKSESSFNPTSLKDFINFTVSLTDLHAHFHRGVCTNLQCLKASPPKYSKHSAMPLMSYLASQMGLPLFLVSKMASSSVRSCTIKQSVG